MIQMSRPITKKSLILFFLAAIVLLLVNIPLSYSESAVDFGASRIFTHFFPKTLSNASTGDYYRPAHSYPTIPVDSKYKHALTFQMSQFFPARREVLPGNGPLILFSDEMDVLIFSPLNHFYVSLIDFKDGVIRYGIEGEIQDIPAGFEHNFILVSGKGMNATIERWGDLLRAQTGKLRVDRYADTGLSYLGYWTNAGAAYYWKTIPGKNYEQTLLAVKAEADTMGIPYRYFQIDSWWYYTKKPGLTVKGTKRWEPRPDVFPKGLSAFQEQLGLPLIAHTRWFAPNNEHAKDYPFQIEKKVAIPFGREFFDHIMASARSWGIETYEQDWLMGQYWWTNYLRDGVDHTETWLKNMDDAAADHDMTMQICMAGAAHVMDSVNRRSWTTVRSSIDYRPGYSKESYWPQFHIANMIVNAAGLLPFKDNFRTAEKHGEAEALISNLSAGMVGPSDEVGRQNKEYLLRTCRSDGLLLKPDRPATPIDAMFLPHSRPFITTTYSDRSELGKWTYLAAYHFAKRHPKRRLSDFLYARLTYDGHGMDRFFVYPKKVTNWRVDLQDDLGIDQPMVAYNWRTGTATAVQKAFDLPAIMNLYDFEYLILAPIFSNGLSLLGETGKFITIADKRFTKIYVEKDSVRVLLSGAPDEIVTIRAYDITHGVLLDPVSVSISMDGTALVEIARR